MPDIERGEIALDLFPSSLRWPFARNDGEATRLPAFFTKACRHIGGGQRLPHRLQINRRDKALPEFSPTFLAERLAIIEGRRSAPKHVDLCAGVV